jgi:hypothetical protein
MSISAYYVENGERSGVIFSVLFIASKQKIPNTKKFDGVSLDLPPKAYNGAKLTATTVLDKK